MAEVEAGIFARLSGQAGVTNLVGKRIYGGIAPQDSTMPHITYFKVSEYQPHSMIVDSGPIRPRIQVDIWSTGYGQSKAIARAVRTALQDYSGTTGGITFQRIFFEDENELPEIDPGTQAVTHHVAQDYFAWHN